jgi:hypothetical protein
LFDIGKYALAVEIENSMFEIFDILYFDKDSEIDIRYKSGTLDGAIGFYPKDNKKIKIGAFWNGSDFISADEKNYVEVDPSQDIYVFTSQNIVFGAVIKDKNTLENSKYQAAFEGNVIIINVSSESNVGLGDFWDSKKLINAVY